MGYCDLVSQINFFREFTHDELVLISEICKEEYYPKNSIIFEENTPADKLYFIIYGQIKISHNLEKVGEEELVILDKGECFGEMALIDGCPRSASALAETDTKLLLIKKDDIDLIMTKNRDIAVKILKKFCNILSARLRDANKQISEITGLFMSFRTQKNIG